MLQGRKRPLEVSPSSALANIGQGFCPTHPSSYLHTKATPPLVSRSCNHCGVWSSTLCGQCSWSCEARWSCPSSATACSSQAKLRAIADERPCPWQVRCGQPSWPPKDGPRRRHHQRKPARHLLCYTVAGLVLVRLAIKHPPPVALPAPMSSRPRTTSPPPARQGTHTTANLKLTESLEQPGRACRWSRRRKGRRPQ